MSALTSPHVLRPARGLKGWLMPRLMAQAPLAFALLRRLRPVLTLGSTTVVTRYDDVIEVFRRDDVFDTPYKAQIDVLTGGEPFFLGMRDGADYRDDVAAMRKVMRAEDLGWLGDRAQALASAAVAAGDGRLDVVSDLVRKVTFDLYVEYLGIPRPPEGEGHLEVWATRLFEFQFAGSPDDHALRADVDEIAPAFRTHIDAEIARRKTAGEAGADDVMARCLQRQAQGDAQFTDTFIRTNLLCMMVGGPPQPPMVVPHAMEQLLRRPDALADAVTAARADDDMRLWALVREALRFDPLGPGLPRVATVDLSIACGTPRETQVPAGATVFAAFASAMRDPRRLPDPEAFATDRLDHEYIHFGHGLHECFGRQMNEATLHRMLKPLLTQPSLRRASGAAGRLSKNGIFSDRLVVRYDPPAASASSTGEPGTVAAA